MPAYKYSFKLVADVSKPIPGLTEMFEEMTGQRITMSGEQVDVCNPYVTAEEPLTLEQLETVMEAIQEGFEKQDNYSNVRVYFFGKEEFPDGPIQ